MSQAIAIATEKRKKPNTKAAAAKKKETKKKPVEEEKKEKEVIDLSQSDEEEETKVKGQVIKNLVLEAFRAKLQDAAKHVDMAEDMLRTLRKVKPAVCKRRLEWEEQVKPVDLSDPDSELLIPQMHLQLLKQRFEFRDGHSWIEVMVLVDPVHWALRIVSKGDDDSKYRGEALLGLEKEGPTSIALEVVVDTALKDIFEDIYSDNEDSSDEDEEDDEEKEEEEEEEEEEEPVANKKKPRVKAEPAALAQVNAGPTTQANDKDDEPMPQADGEDSQVNGSDKKKKQARIPDEFQVKLAEILHRGLFRRNDYSKLVYELISWTGDREAFKELLAAPEHVDEDSNRLNYERTRVWAQVTRGKKFSTDQDLLEMVRQFNLACVELQNQRLDCIKEVKTMCYQANGLKLPSNDVWWRRVLNRSLAQSMMNLENMRNCTMLGLGHKSSWADVRKAAEDLLADGQAMPLGTDASIVFDAEAELKPVQEAWTRVSARIKADGYAENVL